MLSFFRKYQKFFFIFVAIIIIISFTFFGVVSGPRVEEPHREDRQVGKKLDGTSLMAHEQSLMMEVLGHSILDAKEEREFPRLMNGGFLEKEWMSSGFASMAARHDFLKLKGEFEERIVSILGFKPYVHPHDPSLAVMALYGKYAPKVNGLLTRLQLAKDPLSLENYLLYMQLYLAEKELPADFLKQVLLYEEKMRGLEHDPFLDRAYLGLFGFKTLEDWFGKVWLEKSATYVLNIAALAKKQGYRLSLEEGRSLLYQKIFANYNQVFRKALDEKELYAYLNLESHRLQVSEKELLDVWRSVFLCDKLLKDVGSSTFLDPLMLKTFQAFSHEAKRVELLEIKKPLRLKNLEELFLFETYLRGISGNYRDLDLPSPDSIEQIVRRAPQLVERSLTLEYRKVSQEEALSLMSTKETWEWESKNRQILQKEFPEFFKTEEALETLSSKERLQVDQFARMLMLKEHPEKVHTLLALKPFEKEEVGLRMAGGRLPLRVENLDALKQKLLQAGTEPFQYHEEEGDFYEIRVLSKQSPVLLPFEKAKHDGTLGEMLDAKLESLYQDLKKKKNSAVYDKAGKLLPLSQVRHVLGKSLYGDLLKAIEKEYQVYFQKDFPSFENHANFRFLKGLASQENLPEEWQFSRQVLPLSRNAPYSFAKEEMFTLPLNTWSSIRKGEGGNLTLYRVLEDAKIEPSLEAQAEKGHSLLAEDARRSFILDLLEKIDLN